MKRSIVALVTLVLLFVTASLAQQSGWEWQSPKPTGNHLNSIHFVNTNIGFVVGWNGTILKTTDGGQSWSDQYGGTREELRSVAFADSTTGIVVGDRATILRTTNGGTTWLQEIVDPEYVFYDVTHVTAQTWIAVGSENNLPFAVIMRSTDGGATWLRHPVAEINRFFRVHFTDTTDGYTIGEGGMIYYTSDGGSVWIKQESGTPYSLVGVAFPEPNRGIIVGDQGTILQTTDKGTTWVSKVLTSTYNLSNIHMQDRDSGFVFGYGGIPLRTTNGGDTWIPYPNSMNSWLGKMNFVSDKIGFVAGYSGKIFRTTDGGFNWTETSINRTKYLTSVSYSGPRTATAVGSPGMILRTTDGGKNWITQNSGVQESLFEIAMYDDRSGVAINENKILKTTDAGATWLVDSSLQGRYLYKVSFPTFSTIVLLSNLGTVFFSSNRGISWRESSTEPCYFPRALSFIDGQSGTLVDWEGRILRTTDSGLTWNSQTSGTTQQLLHVSFYNSNIGTIVGAAGIILHTTNGGSTWIKQLDDQLFDLYAVVQIDESTATASGEMGTILRTTNGGLSWERQPTLTTNTLRSMSFVAKNEGLAVGGDLYGEGMILHTSTGGFVLAPGTIPHLLISPDTVVFEQTAVGCHRDGATTALRDDSSPLSLNITRVYSSNPSFVVSPATATLSLNSSQKNFAVTFAPQHSGTHHGTILFYDDSGNPPYILYVIGTGGELSDSAVSVNPHLGTGWQLLSLPVASRQTSCLPVGELYSFYGGYVLEDSMKPGVGYWNKREYNAVFVGDSLLENTTYVHPRWNIVGSITVPIPVASIQSSPPNLVTSQFFGYDGSYHAADTIQPGRAYWVKTQQEGALILSSTGISSRSNHIIIVPTSELPPPPPNSENVQAESLPLEFSVHQNYPNPFNPTTTLTYDVAKTGSVALKIYDVLGREVATLVNEIKSPGSYSVQWNPTDKPSGIYFYRLSTSGYSITKKMVLMK